MIHICPITNKKWNCECGNCGYTKTRMCLFHQVKDINETSLDLKLLTRCK